MQNRRPRRDGRYALYWMQGAQRVSGKPALSAAIREANRLSVPVVVTSGLTEHHPSASARPYRFLLQGLAEVASGLSDRWVGFLVQRASPDDAALCLAPEACLLVTDSGSTRHQRACRDRVASEAPCQVLEVDTEAVVPPDAVSLTEEYSAATLHPKLWRVLGSRLASSPLEAPWRPARGLELEEGLDVRDPGAALETLGGGRSVAPVALRGGAREARRRLAAFVEGRRDRCPDDRSNPLAEATSELSPYLYFGQISPLDVALAVAESGSPGADAFLEQLPVRARPLAQRRATQRVVRSLRGGFPPGRGRPSSGTSTTSSGPLRPVGIRARGDARSDLERRPA